MRIFLNLLFISTIGFLSCKSDTGKATATPVVAPVKTPAAVQFESIPREDILYLFNNCDYTDYIFYDLPFSMSQSTENSIKANISYISTEVQPNIPPGCKSIARQMFHVGGDIVKEMDVYYGSNCAFYALMENEKPVAANKMTESGLAFYKQMIDQGMKQNKNIRQGQ